MDGILLCLFFGRSRSKEKAEGGDSSKEKKKDKDDKEDEKEKDAGVGQPGPGAADMFAQQFFPFSSLLCSPAFLKFYIILCVWVCVYHLFAWCHLHRMSGVTDGVEVPCGPWESNLSPLEEKPVLITAEPALQP